MDHRWSLTAALTLAIAGPVAAAGGTDSVQFHGFAAVSAVATDHNQFFGDSEEGSLDFHEIGANASWRLGSRFMLAGQVLSRRAGELYDGAPQLDYGLLNIALAESLERRATLRIGRIKNPLGLYNETRDVPFTRPGIFLPQTIYFDKIRNSLLSTDGAMLSLGWAGEYGDLELDVGVGRPVIDKNVEWTLLSNDFPGRLESDFDSMVASLAYTSADGSLRLKASGMSAHYEYNAAGIFDIPEGNGTVEFGILSAEYTRARWTFAAEYLYLPLRWENFGGATPVTGTDGEDFYLQAIYRIHPRVALLARYEHGVADRGDGDGDRLSAATGGQIPGFFFRDRAFTLGATWEVNRRLMLRAEYATHDGAHALSLRDNAPSELRRDWQVFALQAAVRF